MALTKLFQSTATILVVEDDQITRDLLISLAKRMGFSEAWSSNEGGGGLQTAAKNKPTIIVTDLQMEPVDGLMLLGGLRASRVWEVATAPVFIFTAHKDVDALKSARMADVAQFLLKPFNPGLLSEKLAEAVTKRLAEVAEWKKTGALLDLRD